MKVNENLLKLTLSNGNVRNNFWWDKLAIYSQIHVIIHMPRVLCNHHFNSVDNTKQFLILCLFLLLSKCCYNFTYSSLCNLWGLGIVSCGTSDSLETLFWRIAQSLNSCIHISYKNENFSSFKQRWKCVFKEKCKPTEKFWAWKLSVKVTFPNSLMNSSAPWTISRLI